MQFGWSFNNFILFAVSKIYNYQNTQVEKFNTKIFQLIRSFTDKEITEFRKLISSNLYSSGRNYIPLLNEIIRYNKIGLENVSLHSLYEKLYPGKKYSSQTLKNRFSELFKLGEDYIAFEHLKKHNIEKEKILLTEYLDRRLHNFFESKYRKTKKLVDAMADNDYKFRNIAFLNGINLSMLNRKSRIESMYKQYNDRADYDVSIFFIQLFEYGIEFLLQEYDERKVENNIVKYMLSNCEIEKLIENLNKTNVKIHKYVKMFFYIYKAFENPEEEANYYEARKLFRELRHFLSDDLKNEVYKSMISYCIIRQNSGVKKFQHELFDLYNEKLQQGLYSEFRNRMFPVNTFRDYVYIGIEIGEYKWVENFIRKYSKELPHDVREDEINLSFAKLYFSSKQFKKALENLSHIKGKNYLHYSDSSVLRLCCYYEMARYEDAFGELDKFKHYLRNHPEMPKIHKTPNISFMKVYQKILNSITQSGKSDLGILEKEINSYKNISRRKWLLEKIPD